MFETVMLSGVLPSSHNSKPALFEMIKRGEFEFPSPWWDDVSPEAKDLINRHAHTLSLSRARAHTPTYIHTYIHTYIRI